jgi:type VI secretion system secreted protein Hcp
MALNAFLKLNGQKQGQIKGSVTQKGREGKIMVIAVSHEIVSPRDVATGLASGKNQLKPLMITKEVDKSSPLLYSAFCNHERITEFELQFWKPKISAGAGAGVEVQYYSIILTNATICDMKFMMLNNKNPELVRYAEYEEVSFTYESIEFVWTDGNVRSLFK